MLPDGISPDLQVFLLRHLLRSRAVFRRGQAARLTVADFAPFGDFSPPAPRLVAEAMLAIGSAPVSPEGLLVKLQELVSLGRIDPRHLPEVAGLAARLFDESAPLMEEHAGRELFRYLTAVRGEQVKNTAAGDLGRLHDEYRKVIFPLQAASLLDGPAEERFHRPFLNLMQRRIHASVSTGMPRLDTLLGGGLGYGSFGLIIGFSGCGKTALANAFARGAALQGYRVIYCSMEEEPEDLAYRNYSAVFRINYTSLRNGQGTFMELEQRIRDGDEAEKVRLLQQNLVLLDLKGATPITASRLKEMVDEYSQAHDFAYQLLIVDQMQFMEPADLVAGEDGWVREARTAKELDEISHQAVGGRADCRFALWVLHQAKGKVKLNFTSEDISGFKGVIHKPETVLGIGRENLTSDSFEVFSLKNRHASNFRLGLRGDLAFMSFIEQDAAADPPAGSIPAVPRPAAGLSPMLVQGVDRAVLEGLLTPSPVAAPAVPEALLGPLDPSVRALNLQP